MAAPPGNVDIPVFSLACERPSDFASCTGDTQFIAMPTGILFGVELEFVGAAGGTVFERHVFDMSSAEPTSFWNRVCAAGVLAISLENAATQESARYNLPFDSGTLGKLLDRSKQELAEIKHVDGARATADFHGLCKNALEKHADGHAAWQAALETARSNARAERVARAVERDAARRRRFYYFARGIQIVSAIPLVGPWIVLLSVPILFGGLVLWVPGVRHAVESNTKLVTLLIMLPATLWAGLLDGTGILRLDLPIPFVKIPFWVAGIFFVLASILALIFGS